MKRCHWIGWVGAAAPAADTKKPARSALFDGGLVDLQLRALDNPSKLACSLFSGMAPVSLLLRPWTTPYLNNPSKLACDHPGMEADWSPTARFL